VLPPFYFRDRDLLPTYDPSRGGRNVRVVPGGSTVRRGSYLGDGVVVMPPAYVNVGAYVGAGSLIDSHVLVGSCAQVGARVHLSAAAQIGGVIEPVGGMPVVVEDDAFVGGGCGLYEGARVRRGAVLAPGVVITRAVPLVDLVRETTIVADASGVLEVPERAVVVPGTRPPLDRSPPPRASRCTRRSSSSIVTRRPTPPRRSSRRCDDASGRPEMEGVERTLIRRIFDGAPKARSISVWASPTCRPLLASPSPGSTGSSPERRATRRPRGTRPCEPWWPRVIPGWRRAPARRS
jgi:acetyltransferase-like isoleucine patch superfamily enzyme